MSLPEVLLVLREDHRREASRALLALQTEALAAFAVWDKEAGRKLENLYRTLGAAFPPKHLSDYNKLNSVFVDWRAQVTQ